IIKMLWLVNLPNLNIIEKAWFYMKKEIIKRGLITNRKKLKARWENKIQEWIEAIPYYVKEIIRLEGGNKYKEGR
ncbi:uncharacterized protein K444DRAFT_493812, partial [Hyaloscypha bicolor E]